MRNVKPQYPKKARKPLCLVIREEMNPPTRAHLDMAENCAKFMSKATGRQVRLMFIPSAQCAVDNNTKKGQVKFPDTMRAEMLLKLLSTNSLDAAITNYEIGEERSAGMNEILNALKETDPSMDYMPVVSREELPNVSVWGMVNSILENNGLLVAVTDPVRCRDGHTAKKEAREYINGRDVFAQHSSRIYITDRTDANAVKTSSEKARMKYTEGDYDGVAKECGYYVTQMIENYKTSGRYEPEHDWYQGLH